ncbi:MAG: DEAD/DEAH box helicase [Halobacteriaceae archaeon]
MTEEALPAEFSAETFHDVAEAVGRPVLTARDVADTVGCSQAEAEAALVALVEDGRLERREVGPDPVVYYAGDWSAMADRERVVLFPDRHEFVVDQPTQFTRARLAQFAHLVDANREGGYIYEVRPEDVWHAPYDDVADLLDVVGRVAGRRAEGFEEWLREQFERARQFTLRTHPDGYTVLEAATPEVMGNVARQKLSDAQLRADISETESWVAEAETAAVKRTLYEAGYPVVDERDLETGDPLDVELAVELRDYQREWVEAFVERQAGVLVGPPGSGKTVAAMGAIAAVGGETLVLVPSRELAGQWRAALLEQTSLQADEVGEYHGGEKTIAPVTVATYQTAGMDRHHDLFDSRAWGLIVYDEVHHVPADVFRRSTTLQSKHRLGLSATPVREDDREADIYTLIGPPIGTDWDALFEAGFVQEPRVEIRLVGWASETARNEYAAAEGRERDRVAATNPAKVAEVERLRAAHADRAALVFVDYLDQGEAIADALDAPFVSGQTPHHERERLFAGFRSGDSPTLVVSRVGDEGIDLPDAEVAIVASGLGGSRRQGAQRAGRTMRPAGSATMYVLATQGTREEEFARRQVRHLREKGIRVNERTV